MKGRIVVCKEYGKPFEIEEYDVPTPESGAVLLRMTQHRRATSPYQSERLLRPDVLWKLDGSIAGRDRGRTIILTSKHRCSSLL